MRVPLVPAGRRELTRSHITFYRAVLEGVDARKAWDLYLGPEGDFSPPLSDATLAWVRKALISEALTSGQPALVGLFRRDPSRIKTSSRPTLAEFSQRLEDAGEWSEAELLEMWREEFGRPDRAEERRARLSLRLRQALQLLERAQRRSPRREDPVSQWLSPRLSERLVASGLHTLGATAAALAKRTTPRWEAVPGIGEVWADRLQAWLNESGLRVEPSALPGPSVSALQPLERFQLPSPALAPLLAPSDANPSTGLRNVLGARNDKHAIELWLAARATNPHTLRAYRKNAERLLLWCYLERRTTFAELDVNDCIHYRTWLTDLGRVSPDAWSAAGWRLPAEEWIGPRAARRDSAAWRPFEGPLSPNSIAQDLLTVRSLFEFLVRGRYLEMNPWDLMGKRLVARARLSNATEQFTGRSLSPEQWQLLVAGLSLDGSEAERRLLLLLWLGFACGLRAAEMLSLTLGSLDVSRDAWRLRVLGKGGKFRIVPLPSPARAALLAYLESVGLSFDEVVRAASGSSGPVVAEQPVLRGRRGRRRTDGSQPPTSSLGPTRLYAILKDHLRETAEGVARRNPVSAAKLRAASTHWLRHSCATLALRGGVPLTSVQRLLGHSELTTTSTYVTAQDEALQAEMEAFAANVASGVLR